MYIYVRTYIYREREKFSQVSLRLDILSDPSLSAPSPPLRPQGLLKRICKYIIYTYIYIRYAYTYICIHIYIYIYILICIYIYICL